MSKKPEGIPEGIWELALAVVYEIGESEEHDTEPVARAIMAAVEAEREACAKEAERKFFPGRIGTAGPSPEAIAAAIRNRRETLA